MGWHRNHAISHSPNQIFFEDTFVSHPGGPNEQFGTHEKLSWGGAREPKLDAGVICMKKFGLEKIIFDKMTAVRT